MVLRAVRVVILVVRDPLRYLNHSLVDVWEILTRIESLCRYVVTISRVRSLLSIVSKLLALVISSSSQIVSWEVFICISGDIISRSDSILSLETSSESCPLKTTTSTTTVEL